MKKSMRTNIMIQNFMKYHNEGKTISEIAEACDVSIWTVYNNLDVIAKENGISRDSLLERVHRQHELKNGMVFTKHNNIDPKELKEDFQKVQENINKIIKQITQIIEEG